MSEVNIKKKLTIWDKPLVIDILWLTTQNFLIYRDSDLPAKKLDLERDAGDYINIRVNGGANGLIHIRWGMRLRVHGFQQSRDYRESQEEFICKTWKFKDWADLAVDIKACGLKQNQVLVDRNVVEAVA